MQTEAKLEEEGSSPGRIGMLFPAAWRKRPGRRGLGEAPPRIPPPEEFERELVELGLSGRRFEAADYAGALGDYLGLRILVQYLDDRADPVFRRRLAHSGRLAESHYFEAKRTVAVLVPSSLPPLVLELTLLHELAHLAAGDLTRSVGGRRLAARPPHDDEQAREDEADARALHVLVAGRLGPDNPYAQAVYEVP